MSLSRAETFRIPSVYRPLRGLVDSFFLIESSTKSTNHCFLLISALSQAWYCSSLTFSIQSTILLLSLLGFAQTVV
jgi:hypothetical protein